VSLYGTLGSEDAYHEADDFCWSVLVAFAAGCDPATGVVRTVNLTSAPSNQKVETALRDLVGEKGFEHQTEQDADQWSIRNGAVVLEIKHTNKGAKTLQFRSLRFGSSTLAEVADTRKLMDEIYASLRKQSPDLPEATTVHERLIRVKK